MASPEDSSYMARALQLARRGIYSTRPNPAVGCVLVRDGVVIGQGTTRPAGQNHAEIEALNEAGESDPIRTVRAAGYALDIRKTGAA